MGCKKALTNYSHWVAVVISLSAPCLWPLRHVLSVTGSFVGAHESDILRRSLSYYVLFILIFYYIGAGRGGETALFGHIYLHIYIYINILNTISLEGAETEKTSSQMSQLEQRTF